jgi:protein-S-isoprenylcysteine O-methyltransferase Ste14
MADGRRSVLGGTLVVAQFGALGLLAWWAAPALRLARAPGSAWALLLVASALGAWALYANRPGNFNIRPAPRAGGRLVRHGPYRWIRHPMYTSVMALGAGCAVAASSGAAVALLAVLVGVLAVKASLEERWMADIHPEYAAYRSTSWRFVPWVF